MQTPVEIEFQGLKGSDQLRVCVMKNISVLEQRFGRITACRVVVKAPSERHRTGGACEITIRLSLPQGREVDIGRSEKAEKAADRRADPVVALNDAFKRARRRLSDHTRRMRGHVKSHDGPPIATVKRFDEAAGFGFLETPGGFDYTGADGVQWLQEAGFRDVYVEHLVGPDSMVVGFK